MPRTLTFDLTIRLTGTVVLDDPEDTVPPLTADVTATTADTTLHTTDEAQ